MARWEPGAAERLQKAAFELFAAQGFEQTTAADIAAAAGLTERTFFRYFGDKRDVLFYGQDVFVAAFLDGMAAEPDGVASMRLVAASLKAAGSLFPDRRRTHSRLRQGVIDANPPLQERERHKLAGLATSVAAALRGRGIPEPAATLSAETGAMVFSVGFAQWIRPGEDRSLPAIVSDVLAQLKVLVE